MVHKKIKTAMNELLKQKLPYSKMHHYLGTGLQLKYNENVDIPEYDVDYYDDNRCVTLYSFNLESVDEGIAKPLCHRLSSLTKPVLPEGKIPLVEIANKFYGNGFVLNGNIAEDILHELWFDKDSMRFLHSAHSNHTDCPLHILEMYETLLSYHFWLWDQSLFESGEIIDLNTIER
jgi:hypothetical protein